MAELVSAVECFIVREKLLEPGESLVIAVSGGLDSLLLLHVLNALSDSWKWRLTVAHFNHRLRGRAGDLDQQHVRNAARRLGLPCLMGSAQVRAVARARGISVEMAGRDLRHNFLAGVARQCGARAIALGHHQDDQIELFLLRLLRGAGPEGLPGMRAMSVSPVDKHVRLVRPFLDLPRARLLEEATQRRLNWREDASNRKLDPWRNRVRHELLPLLRRRFHPAIGTVLHRTMDLLRAESELAQWATAWWLRKRPKPEFQRLPLAVQRRSIRQQLIELGIPPDFGIVERLRNHVGTPWSIAPDRGLLLNARGRVAWVESDRAGFQNQRQWLDLTPRAGGVHFAGRTIHWSRRKVQRRIDWRAHGGPGREVFDAARVGETIVLRHWQPGDRLQPIGFPKPAKLQDLFVANKVPRSERRHRLVAETAAGEIFWVEGLRISERFKVQSGSRQLLLWRWR